MEKLKHTALGNILIDDAVTITAAPGRLIIEPVRREPSLDDLLASFTPGTPHDLAVSDVRVGAEQVEW